jgi:tRNA-dihydrouridine synthase
VDLNVGCPIDIICQRQAGSALLLKPRRFEEVVRAATGVLDVPLIVKMRWVHVGSVGTVQHPTCLVSEQCPLLGTFFM